MAHLHLQQQQQQERRVVHVIRDDEENEDALAQGVLPRTLSSFTNASQAPLRSEAAEVAAFADAATRLCNLGSAIIKREAVCINRQLVHVQNKRTARPALHDMKSSKKAKTKFHEDISSKDKGGPSSIGGQQPGEQQVSTSSGESRQVWDRVNRMQRLALYLRNAQNAQNLFLEEMKECTKEQQQAMWGMDDRDGSAVA